MSNDGTKAFDVSGAYYPICPIEESYGGKFFFLQNMYCEVIYIPKRQRHDRFG